MRSYPVTIRTDEVTLGNLGLQLSDGNPPIMMHGGDVKTFFLSFSMIKIHHVVWIAHAAVCAWLSLHRSEEGPELLLLAERPGYILNLVLLIILPLPLVQTRAAIALVSPLLSGLELSHRLDELTFAAFSSRWCLIHVHLRQG